MRTLPSAKAALRSIYWPLITTLALSAVLGYCWWGPPFAEPASTMPAAPALRADAASAASSAPTRHTPAPQPASAPLFQSLGQELSIPLGSAEQWRAAMKMFRDAGNSAVLLQQATASPNPATLFAVIHARRLCSNDTTLFFNRGWMLRDQQRRRSWIDANKAPQAAVDRYMDCRSLANIDALVDTMEARVYPNMQDLKVFFALMDEHPELVFPELRRLGDANLNAALLRQLLAYSRDDAQFALPPIDSRWKYAVFEAAIDVWRCEQIGDCQARAPLHAMCLLQDYGYCVNDLRELPQKFSPEQRAAYDQYRAHVLRLVKPD